MLRRAISSATKDLVRTRAGGQCEYCRCPEEFSPDTFSIEHITPVALNGSNAQSNLALSCQGCNGSKCVRIEAFDDVTVATVSLFHPRQQRWGEHFRWSADSVRVEGLSATGRATIEVLRLNRAGVVNLRRLLMLDERHPPD